MEHITIKEPKEALKNFLDMEGFIQDMVELIQKNKAWEAIINRVNEDGGWLRVNVTIGHEYIEDPEGEVCVTRADIVLPGQIGHLAETLAGRTVTIPQLHEHVGKTEDDFPPVPALDSDPEP